MMNTQTITIEVDAATAQAYNTISAEQRRKLDVLLGLKLSEIFESVRPLKEVMSEMSRNAERRGLTPEILDQILQDE